MEPALEQIPLKDLAESNSNPRKRVDKASLKELTESIKAKGIINPLLLRRIDGHYEIVAGGRRYQAAKALNLTVVPAIVRELSDAEALELAVIDNLQRADVHPLDEAEGYGRLLKAAGGNVQAVAAKVGKSAAYIYGRLALGKLIEPAKKAYLSDRIQLGHALLIAKLGEDEQKDALNHGALGRAMSVRELAEYIREEILLDLSGAPWKKDDETLLSRAGSCNACTKRTGQNAELFQDFGQGDRCLDGKCFAAKMQAFLLRKRLELTKGGEKVRNISLEWGGYGHDKSILYEDDYNTWKGCKNPVVGLVVDGKRTGTTKKICIDPSCTKCGRGDSYHSRRHDQPKGQDRYKRRLEIWENRIQQDLRSRLMKAIVPLVKMPVKRLHLVALLRETMEACHRTSIEDAGKLVGIKWSDQVYSVSDIKDYQKKLAKCTDDEILRFIFAISLSRDMIVDAAYGGEPVELLTPLVELHGAGKVNVKEIEAQVRKEFEAKKPKPPKKEENKAVKKGKK